MEAIGFPHFDTARAVVHRLISNGLDKNSVEVSIKRDDLIHPMVSGNKWRKLLPFVKIAKQDKYVGLFSFGGAYSNHLLAMAAACATLGLKSIGIVRGEPDSDSIMLALCRMYGMELIFSSRSDYRNKEQLAEKHCPEGFLIVPEGGSGPVGESGFEGFWEELDDYPDLLITAFGTGTTLRGLLKFKPANARTRIMAIPVLKGFENISTEHYEVVTGFEYGGYGKFDGEIIRTIHQIASQTGVLLDPVYTVKSLKAIMDMIETKKITPGSKVLFLHTGGSFGLLSAKAINYLPAEFTLIKP